MKLLRLIAEQTLTVVIVIIVCLTTLKAAEYKIVKDGEYNTGNIREDKELMAALIKNSDYTQIVQLAIDTEDEELRKYLINNLVGMSVRLKDQKAKELLTELTLNILEEK